MAHCLIADDNKVIRWLLSKIMVNLNFYVLEAEDGEEAVEVVERTEPDVVILDWDLPQLAGIEVLYKIRASNKKQPKVLFCSSVVNIENIKQALDAGADDYIMKPFDEEIITSKLSYLGVL